MITCRVRNSVDIPILSEGHIASFVSFEGFTSPNEHIAIIMGEYRNKSPLVRIHSECLTGDVFGSHRCDCGAQLHEALNQMSQEGGILLYLRQEGRGIGLYAKLDAYKLQDKGLDTFEANKQLNFPEDGRDFSIAANMLTALGITHCRLITNNPEKVTALKEHGIQVDEVISTGIYITKHNHFYLMTKVNKKNHSIKLNPPPTRRS